MKNNNDMTEETRAAARVLLDTCSAMHAAEAARGAAFQLGLRRLTEAGAVTATLEGEDELTVDVTRLVSAALSVIGFLTANAAVATGLRFDDVIAAARRHVDDV